MTPETSRSLAPAAHQAGIIVLRSCSWSGAHSDTISAVKSIQSFASYLYRRVFRAAAATVTLTLCAGCSVGPAWTELFDGESMQGWIATEFGGEGEVSVREGKLILGQGWSLTGITWKGQRLPEHGYEVHVRGCKLKGHDFFAAITFPVGEGFCSLVLGGWGGDVVGISSIDGMDADSNATRQLVEFKQGR